MPNTRTEKVDPLEIDTVGLLAKPRRRCHAPLALSCALNAVFAISLVMVLGTDWFPEVDRSREQCGGHGMLYEGADECECFDCWSGPFCAEKLEGDACVVTANSGTPYIFEEYWVRHPEARTSILPSYHIGYGYRLPRLERAIRSLHKMVGNAEVDGREIVIGIGSTELISAAMYALSGELRDSSSTPTATASVWSQSPFYSGYKMPATFFDAKPFEWAVESHDAGDHGLRVPEATATRPVIELVTSPNNPDGHTREPAVSPGPHSRYVLDHAYLWPHFTAIPRTPTAHGNDTIALFTLSKMTGHASTRIGWAICSNPIHAAKLTQFINTVTFGSPRENQLRAIAALEHANAHHGEIFTFARNLMLSRWQRLEEIFEGQSAYRLEPREAASYDSFSEAEGYEPSPAYAWVELVGGGDAAAAMAAAGITGRSGAEFGASPAFVRLELLMREETFGLLADKLRAMLHP